MSNKKIDTKAVYQTVADSLPEEGRDFKLGVVTDDDGNEKLVIDAITPLGKAWVPFLQNRFSGGDGGTVVSAASSKQDDEVLTVTKIRENAEAATAAALKTKVDSLAADERLKRQAMDAAKKARIAANGENAPMSDEEREAIRLTNAAAAETWKATRVKHRVEQVREAVNAKAKEEAEADKAKGKIWEVDMNAPITTLFDREDATAKFKRKEEAIVRAAELAVASDEFFDRAVRMAKQYILPKVK